MIVVTIVSLVLLIVSILARSEAHFLDNYTDHTDDRKGGEL